MAEVADDNTFSATSSGDDSDADVGTSKKSRTYDSDLSSQYTYGDGTADESEEAENQDDGKDAKEAAEGEDDEDDANEEAYRRYEERSSFNHARIEIDEDYEEDYGFPMYFAGYTHRKKQLPIGMDCWKVKNIPADPELLREMIQDQKVRRDLLAKVMEEIDREKLRLLQVIAEQEA